jgi:UDP-N-acetylmuramoyl-L-alanyl-D-glutamate--2,6-diaminopimelate ligase
MRLGEILLKATPPGLERLEIAGITADSRTVSPGDLFIAVPGTRDDGSRFVADALRRGAAAVVVEATAAVDVPAGAVVVKVADVRRQLPHFAAAASPRQPETVVAVTGTSGKTSVAEFTRQILATLGRSSASLGTLGVMTAAGLREGALTTPGPIELHRMLAGLAAEGITDLAMEASSHGLDQHRLDGVRLAAGAFTNLGRDHMDYHPTVEDYFAAKMRLVRELLAPGRPFVVNADGAWAEAAHTSARERGLSLLTVGARGETLRLAGVDRDGFRQRLSVVHGGRHHDISLPLVGAYQVENALVAAGLAMSTGAPADVVLQALGALKGVAGRLDIVGEARGGLAVVDYAHKPEALTAVLEALRPFATGRLVCVFGCGGDRDKGKRPIMGEIAVRLADLVIVTDDNPRSEVPAAIRAEILAAAPGAREIGDRGEAIAVAIGMMRRGDVVVVAGKGHETGQKIGDTVIPFSDHDEIRKAMAGA